MNVYWFGVAFLWNGLHPIILPAVLLNYVPESLKNTYLGGLTFFGLILAMVTQPLTGALSDRTRSRWGRRRPWILVGASLAVTTLLLLGQSTSLLGIFLAYIVLQTTSNIGHGPGQGLIPDLVPAGQRGLASGIKNLFDMAGIILTGIVIGQLIGGEQVDLAFLVTAGILAVSALITILTTLEKPSLDSQSGSTTLSLRAIMRVDLQGNRDYAWLIAARFFILTGVISVQGFTLYFVRDSLGVPNPAAATGNLLAILGIALTVVVFPAGILSDRIGRFRLNQLGGGLAGIGIFLLLFVENLTTLFIVGGVIGAATGIFISVNWALATELIPSREAGKYLGLSNLATAGAGAAARLAGPLIDSLNALNPGALWGYPTLFIISGSLALVGTFLLNRITVSSRTSLT
jgi:Na+/melibiose symporter-like transporter